MRVKFGQNMLSHVDLDFYPPPTPLTIQSSLELSSLVHFSNYKPV